MAKVCGNGKLYSSFSLHPANRVCKRKDTSQAIAVKAVWLVFAITLQLSYSSSFCFLFCRVVINTLVLPIPIRVILLKGTWITNSYV